MKEDKRTAVTRQRLVGITPEGFELDHPVPLVVHIPSPASQPDVPERSLSLLHIEK